MQLKRLLYIESVLIPHLYLNNAMHELTGCELYQALAYAKRLDEEAASKIIEWFQFDQTALAQTLFEVFPAVIAVQSQDMSEFFLALSFDVLCVFQKAFGPLPPETAWLSTGWKNRLGCWRPNCNR